AVEIAVDVVGLLPDQFVEILQRRIVALQGTIGLAVAVAGVGMAWRQAQGLVVGLQRLLVAAQVLQRSAAGVVQGNVVGLQLSCLGVVAECQLVPILLGIGSRPLLQRRHVV